MSEPKKKREGAAVWRPRVAAWRQSGLSAREFAAREGLSAGSLSWWAWNLRQPSKTEPPNEGSRRRPPRAPTAAEFVALHVAQLAPAAERTEALEVVLPGGARIRVPERFDAQTLTRVVCAR